MESGLAHRSIQFRDSSLMKLPQQCKKFRQKRHCVFHILHRLGKARVDAKTSLLRCAKSVLGRERKRFSVLGMVALQRERKINVIKLKLFQWERDTKTATVNDREDFSADAADIKCQPRNPNREGTRIFNGRFCSKFYRSSNALLISLHQSLLLVLVISWN
uniref:Uncharacterized protein n=1 Tax=Magallana gigas TaxID=29159 RepID=K1PHP9_MAGGI